MKKVLITLDYDSTSQKVAERGYTMAKAMHAEIILLHVISNPILYYNSYAGLFTGMIPPQIENVDQLKTIAQKFLDKTKHDLGNETIRTLVKEGETAYSILETAKELDADIIVLGTHSRKWLENILMGSVAEKVLKDTTLPLFIIPTKKIDE
ncbi:MULTISPECIES: universal stress protein [unclassified Flavobacterium]|jgi:nucleotide-binding universal stress UspA family protein|uniref:universal stress protein n=1 Tax=unclassified Flavobacterium TaxID=196869 RepID=UPI0025C2D066|nr:MULTISPECIES: universal stress protein [unclassified Flavobacterium]